VKARGGAGALRALLAGTAAAKIGLGLTFRGYLTGDDLEMARRIDALG